VRVPCASCVRVPGVSCVRVSCVRYLRAARRHARPRARELARALSRPLSARASMPMHLSMPLILCMLTGKVGACTERAGARNTQVRVWDTRTLACVTVLRGHTHGVLAVAFARWPKIVGAPDNPRRLHHVVLSGSVDGTVRVRAVRPPPRCCVNARGWNL
jgi:hypothetical protein